MLVELLFQFKCGCSLSRFQYKVVQQLLLRLCKLMAGLGPPRDGWTQVVVVAPWAHGEMLNMWFTDAIIGL